MNLAELWNEKSHPQTYGYIGDHTPLQEGKDTYLSVSLESICIPYIRKFVKTFYATLYGNVSLLSSSSADKDFQSVTTLPSLSEIVELDPQHLDRIIQSTLCLLDDVPYRHEGLSVNLCLFSIQSGDLTKSYISLLKSIAKTAGIAFLSQAVPLAEVICNGITDLVNANELEIGLCKEFPIVEEGYYAVIRTDKETLPLAEFSIDPSTHRLLYQNKLVTQLPYFVLRFQFSDKREHWQEIPELQKSYENMITHFRNFPLEYRLNQQMFDAFKVAMTLSDELLEPDKNRLIALAHDQVIDFLEKPKSNNVRRQTTVAKTGLGTRKGISRGISPETTYFIEPEIVQINPEELTARLKSEIKTLSLDKIKLF